jgi:hypothetical protein
MVELESTSFLLLARPLDSLESKYQDSTYVYKDRGSFREASLNFLFYAKS